MGGCAQACTLLRSTRSVAAVVGARAVVDAHRGDLAVPSASPADAGHPALVNTLRAWRSVVARKRGVPAYVVLHDTTIDGIATSRPTTLGQLRDIPGIGDKKLEHYGDELIALVRASPTGA